MLVLLILGIAAISARKSVPSGFVCEWLYTFGGMVGIAGCGFYMNLIIW